MNKSLIISTLCLCLSLPLLSSAQDAKTAKIVVNGSETAIGTMALTTETKITFEGGNAVITAGTETGTYALTDISSITFDLESGAAEEIEADLSDNLSVSISGGIISAVSSTDDEITVNAYGINGIPVIAAKAKGSVTIDTNSLAKGIYIIRINNKVIKYNR